MEGAESILKKRSVRLYPRIFPLQGEFIKSGDNSDHKNDPPPERPPSCYPKARTSSQKGATPTGIAPSALVLPYYLIPFDYTRF